MKSYSKKRKKIHLANSLHSPPKQQFQPKKIKVSPPSSLPPPFKPSSPSTLPPCLYQARGPKGIGEDLQMQRHGLHLIVTWRLSGRRRAAGSLALGAFLGMLQAIGNITKTNRFREKMPKNDRKTSFKIALVFFPLWFSSIFRLFLFTQPTLPSLQEVAFLLDTLTLVALDDDVSRVADGVDVLDPWRDRSGQRGTHHPRKNSSPKDFGKAFFFWSKVSLRYLLSSLEKSKSPEAKPRNIGSGPMYPKRWKSAMASLHFGRNGGRRCFPDIFVGRSLCWGFFEGLCLENRCFTLCLLGDQKERTPQLSIQKKLEPLAHSPQKKRGPFYIRFFRVVKYKRLQTSSSRWRL